MRVWLIAVAAALSACGGDDGGERPPLQVHDQLGRTCSIAIGNDVTCDQAPQPLAGCPAGATPCWALGTTSDAGGPAAICAACCSGDTATSMRVDCSNITCTTPADCPSPFSRCVSGNVCRS